MNGPLVMSILAVSKTLPFFPGNSPLFSFTLLSVHPSNSLCTRALRYCCHGSLLRQLSLKLPVLSCLQGQEWEDDSCFFCNLSQPPCAVFRALTPCTGTAARGATWISCRGLGARSTVTLPAVQPHSLLHYPRLLSLCSSLSPPLPSSISLYRITTSTTLIPSRSFK